MKFKGLAVFSIATMALIAAPQAASDFRNFVAGATARAHTAFLQAILNSERGDSTAVPVQAEQPQPRATICSNMKPTAKPAGAQPKPATWKPMSRVVPAAKPDTTTAPDTAEINVTAEIAQVHVPELKNGTFEFKNVRFEQEMQRAINDLVRTQTTATNKQEKEQGLKFAQQALRSFTTLDNIRLKRICVRTHGSSPSAAPAVKENAPVPPAPPAARPSIPQPTVRTIAFVYSTDKKEDTEPAGE